MNRRERLIYLATALEAAGDAPTTEHDGHTVAFNMNTWINNRRDWNGEICQTACCALGFAGLLPEFRKLGLVTDIQNREIRYPGIDGESTLTLEDDIGMLFFGLSEVEFNHIFYPHNYYATNGVVTRSMVAKRLREVAAKEAA